MRAAVPDAVLVFMIPPDKDVLRQRLEGRQTEEREVIDQRLATALKEVEYIDCYDYVVINDELDKAVADLRSAVGDAREKRKKNSEFIKKFKGEI